MKANREVTRIVIKGSSGYTTMDYAYNDKLTITPTAMSYECNPYFDDAKIKKQKWSYRTDSEAFKASFAVIASGLIEALDKEQTELWCDVGAMEITITFADKTRRKEIYYVLGDYFYEPFVKIKGLLPGGEQVPELIKTNEDYDDYEDEEDDGEV